MRAIRAHLGMFPKWLVVITAIFIIQLFVAMTVYFNIILMLANLAMLFTAFAVREYKHNKIYFALCLVLSISFVITAVQSYAIS